LSEKIGGKWVFGCGALIAAFASFFTPLAARCQFHKHFLHAFFARKFVQTQTLSREKSFVQKMHAKKHL
jgi:hypothetical protein